jgi:hypothetical protein
MLTESLRANDLRNLVRKVFEIDSYKSKIGNDEETVVLCFSVEQGDPAADLEHFIEMGYDFVLDADVSPGEAEDGYYKVFVELERNRKVAGQIREILDGLEKLTGIEDWRFRYYKSFRSQSATESNLEAVIPTDVGSYDDAIEDSELDSPEEFFSDSNADEIELTDESISFKRAFAEPIEFDIITSGPKIQVYDQIPGPLMLEHKDMAEILHLTKQIGNYNITKIGQTFIFENRSWAVALERK